MKKIAVILSAILLLFTISACNTAAPQDFDLQFSFGIGAKNRLDTYKDTLTKDLINAGTAESKLTLSQKDLDQLYRLVKKYNLTEIDQRMTSKNLTTDGNIIHETPLTLYEIKFTINGKTYVIKGDDTAKHYPDQEQAADFMAFCEELMDWFYAREEYKSLPHAEGYYR